MSASVTNIVVNPSVQSASVGDRVWLDADGDGSQDVGEPGIANVEVTLKDQFGTPVATTVTDVNGRYLFSGVAAGNGYYVEVTPSTLPSGLTQSFPALFTNNRTTTFTLSDGQSYTDADVGYKPSATTASLRGPGLGGRQQQRRARRGRDRPRRRHRPALPGHQQQRRGGRR